MQDKLTATQSIQHTIVVQDHSQGDRRVYEEGEGGMGWVSTVNRHGTEARLTYASKEAPLPSMGQHKALA